MQHRHHRAWALGGAVALLALALQLPHSVSAQQARIGSVADIEIVPVRGNIYLVAGAGGNITVSAGPDGVFVVDTGLAENADNVVASIQRLQRQLQLSRPPLARSGAETRLPTNLEPYDRLAPPKPIRYIANTSVLPEHIGGNAKMAEAGKTFTGGNVAGELADVTQGAAVLAHENVLTRMGDAKMPTRALPTETYFGNVMKLSYFFNGEGIELIHAPEAATDGDSLVHFRGSDVIAAGDVLDMTRYPTIDLAKRGSLQGLLAALNRMLDMAVAEFRSEGGTFIIPGHGRVIDTADLAYYRDMTTIIRDRVEASIKKGKTLAEIKASRPTEDWDPRFGTDTTWTPDLFVEAIYKGLTNPPEAKDTKKR